MISRIEPTVASEAVILTFPVVLLEPPPNRPPENMPKPMLSPGFAVNDHVPLVALVDEYVAPTDEQFPEELTPPEQTAPTKVTAAEDVQVSVK